MDPGHGMTTRRGRLEDIFVEQIAEFLNWRQFSACITTNYIFVSGMEWESWR
jgi:hypothetical protein